MNSQEYISEPNKHIEEYLDYYFNGSKKLEYAVLLNGAWGSGKTWFVKKYIEKQEKMDKKVAYISLNGLSKTSDIDDAIFKSIHPVLASKQAKLAGQILKGALKATLKIDLDGDSKDDGGLAISAPDIKLPDYLKIDDKFILVFDDLERCELKIEQTLGYINYFVEQENIKTLIVSNDIEIKENEIFLRKKEKLIGANFSYKEDQGVALKSIIEEVTNCELRNKLISKIPMITETFNTIGYKNLRAFKQSIFDFERFYSEDTFEWQGEFDQEIFEKILKAFLILSLENKAGRFDKKILNFKEDAKEPITDEERHNKFLQHLSRFIGNDAQDFRKKYQVALSDFIFSEKLWNEILNFNIIDKYNIEKELYEVYFRFKEEKPTWYKLWYYLNLSEENFNDLVEDAKESIENSKLNNIVDILHTVSMLLYFKHNNLILFSVEDLLPLAINQYKKNLIVRENIKELHYFDISDNSGGYSFYDQKLSIFENFIANIIDAYREKYVEKNIERVSELINLMKNDSYEFCQQIRNNYFDYPILKSIIPSEFLDELLKIKYESAIHILDGVSSRYMQKSQDKIYLQEEDWFQQVIDSINEKLVLSNDLLEKHKIKDKFLPKLIEIKETAYKGES